MHSYFGHVKKVEINIQHATKVGICTKLHFLGKLKIYFIIYHHFFEMINHRLIFIPVWKGFCQ